MNPWCGPWPQRAERLGPVRAMAWVGRLEKLLVQLDVDSDGMLDRSELFEFFRDADMNMDGLVTLPEYSQYAVTMG